MHKVFQQLTYLTVLFSVFKFLFSSIEWLDDLRSTSFSKVFQSYQRTTGGFQSYQDDGWMITKGCVQWNPVYA